MRAVERLSDDCVGHLEHLHLPGLQDGMDGVFVPRHLLAAGLLISGAVQEIAKGHLGARVRDGQAPGRRPTPADADLGASNVEVRDVVRPRRILKGKGTAVDGERSPVAEDLGLLLGDRGGHDLPVRVQRLGAEADPRKS